MERNENGTAVHIRTRITVIKVNGTGFFLLTGILYFWHRLQYRSQATWQTSASDTHVWSACSRVNFRQPRVPGTRVSSARACAGTRKYLRLDSKKNLTSLWARYSFTASLLSTILLKLSKSLVPRRVTVLAITFMSTQDSSWKNTENRKLIYA